MVGLGESGVVQPRDAFVDTDFIALPDEPTMKVGVSANFFQRLPNLLDKIAYPPALVVFVFHHRQPFVLRFVVRHANRDSVAVTAAPRAEDFLPGCSARSELLGAFSN